MKLDKRLSAAAAFVPPGVRLADIGTDHAYLPAALLQTGKVVYAVAADIAADPCRVAKNTLRMQGVARQSEVRQGSGLSVLQPGECDCIVIAGMGGPTIVEILAADLPVARSAKRLILQPMVGAAAVRKFLLEQGFALVAEDLVEDGKFLYEIIVAEYPCEGLFSGECGDGAADRPDRNSVFTDVEQDVLMLVGPLLFQQHHPLLSLHLARQKGILQRTLAGMGKSKDAMTSRKYRELQSLLCEMEKLEKNL